MIDSPDSQLSFTAAADLAAQYGDAYYLLDTAQFRQNVEQFRGAKGQQMVDKDGCAAVVERRLREGGMLSLLADQHAGNKGCWVDFLGVPASCHKALALFSLGSSAPMCRRRALPRRNTSRSGPGPGRAAPRG